MKDFNEWLAGAPEDNGLIKPSEIPNYIYRENGDVKFSIQQYQEHSNIYGKLRLGKDERLEYVAYNVSSTEQDVIDAMEKIYGIASRWNMSIDLARESYDLAHPSAQ